MMKFAHKRTTTRQEKPKPTSGWAPYSSALFFWSTPTPNGLNALGCLAFLASLTKTMVASAVTKLTPVMNAIVVAAHGHRFVSTGPTVANTQSKANTAPVRAKMNALTKEPNDASLTNRL